MRFYDNYAKACAALGLVPCSQKTADLFDSTRATISIWNTKGTTPNGETVAAIADALKVSADFLLGRTDDPTDYSDGTLIANAAGPVLDHFDGDVKKTVAFKAAVDADAMEERNQPEILRLYSMLDDADKIKIEGVIQGMLLADKYKKQNLA